MSYDPRYEIVAEQLNARPRSNQDTPPTFSIASAVFNVAPYLGEFLAAIDRQDIQHSELELLLVDDGSTDDSLEVMLKWSKLTKINHKIITKNNGGQASARNIGIDESSGTWITFLDPDDYVSDNYFSELANAISNPSYKNAEMFVSHLWNYYDDTGEVSNTHALRKRFRDGDRLIDLYRSPDFFHMSGPTALLKATKLRVSGLRFEEKLRFSFEDAHFVSMYLLSSERPLVGYVTGARYYYRRRSTGNSSIQLGAARPEKYTDVLEFGHISLVNESIERFGRVPKWLQYLFLYDILWYFRGDRKVGAPSRSLPDETTSRFHQLMQRIVNEIDRESIHSFDVMGTDAELRDALLLGYKSEKMTTPTVEVSKIDEVRQLTMLSYVYSGSRPAEIVDYRGLSYVPAMAKSKAYSFLGKVLYVRRYLWIPSNGTFSLTLDGEPAPLVLGRAPRPVFELRPHKTALNLLGHAIGSRPKVRVPKGAGSRNPIKRIVGTGISRVQQVSNAVNSVARSWSDPMSKLLSKSMSAASKQKYLNAWVLLDRLDQANDNAEHLYRFISREKPSVNAWFALRRSSADWDRLSRDGFKLVDVESDDFICALLNSKVYASSHLDRFITDPLPAPLRKHALWMFVFLQHGVTKDDQSAWFNSKNIDLLVTATKPEFESITADLSPYKFSSKEVALTGFPRHDALTLNTGESKRKWILLSPTWRASLSGVVNADGTRVKNPQFADSLFAESWRELISSSSLSELAKKGGYEIALLPHPNLMDYVEELNLPSSVKLLSWSDMPFGEVVDRSALMITDYSSTAFEAAYANVPVVYFQFDAEGTKSAGHIYDRGYFDYELDGFGPVCQTATGVVDAIDKIVASGERMEFADRRNSTFVFRDKKNSQRVFEEISMRLKKSPASDVLTILD